MRAGAIMKVRRQRKETHQAMTMMLNQLVVLAFEFPGSMTYLAGADTIHLNLLLLFTLESHVNYPHSIVVSYLSSLL
jgi:hypothetical protein